MVELAQTLQLGFDQDLVLLTVVAFVALLAHVLVLCPELLTLEQLVNVVVEHSLLLPEDL